MRFQQPGIGRKRGYLSGTGIAGLAGSTMSSLGFHWDIIWHADIGRDTFWSPPHLLIVAGLFLGLVAATRALTAGGWGDAPNSARRRPGVMLMLTGSLFALAVLAFDNWWHQLFGVDLLLWSPPHLLLAVAFQLSLAGAIVDLTAGERPPALPAVLWGLYLGMASILLLEFEIGLPSYSVIWEPLALAVFFGLTFRVALDTAGHPMAGTLAGLSAVLFRLAANGLNVAFGRTLSAFPLGLVLGGLGFDLARRSLQGRGPGLLQKVSIPLSLTIAWGAFLFGNGAWRRFVGRVWWEPGVILIAITAGPGLVLLGSRFGAFLGRHLNNRTFGAPSGESPLGRLPAWPVATAWTALIAGVISLSGVPLMADLTGAAQFATLSHTGTEMTLAGKKGRSGDWVSVFGVRRPQDSKTVWLGSLRREGSHFTGSLPPSEVEWLLIWFQHKNRAWATFAEPYEKDLPLRLTTQNFRPRGRIEGWEGPVGYSIVFLMTGLASAALLFCLRSLGPRGPDGDFGSTGRAPDDRSVSVGGGGQGD